MLASHVDGPGMLAVCQGTLFLKPELGCDSIRSTILDKRPSWLLFAYADTLFTAGLEAIYMDGAARIHHTSLHLCNNS
jgi:hypothetical protein